MNIHFVCYGNVFRSRLAEAYLNAQLIKLKIQNVEISSSGTRADGNHQGPVSWYALRIINNDELTPYMKSVWTQLSQDQIDTADAVVFMHDSVFEGAKEILDNLSDNYSVWDIEDISSEKIRKSCRDQDDFDLEVIHLTEGIFEKIKVQADILLEDIQRIVS